MEKNFLLKEEEFHKLNAELEARTQELLKEVEDVMKIQERITKTKSHTPSNFRESSSSSSDNHEDIVTVSLNDTKCMISNNSHCASRSSVKYARRGSSARRSKSELPHLTPTRGVMSLDVLHVPDESGNKFLPESSFAMGTEGTIRFLKAKLNGLQKEMDGLQTDYKKRTEEWRKVQAEMKQVEEDRNKWQHQTGSLKETIKKLELQNSSSSSKLAQKETENANLRKELETLKKELKTVLHSSSANEIRLNRSLEELDKLRSELQNYKRNDKELHDITRRKGEEVAATVRLLEKQKLELFHAFKKQQQLINNLKKQKIHLKAACLIQFSEAEFMKLLEWCPDVKPLPRNVSPR